MKPGDSLPQISKRGAGIVWFVYWLRCVLYDVEFDFRQGQESSRLPNLPSRALGPTQPAIHWVPWLFIAGVGEMVRWLGHRAGDLLPYSGEVKNQWRCISTLTVCLHEIDRNNFTFLDCFILEDGTDRLPQTSVTDYQWTLHNISE